jgi:hypothetical protein
VTGIKIHLLALTAFIGLGLQGQDYAASASGQNCTFQANPDRFLGQQARIIKVVFDRAMAFDGSRVKDAAAGGRRGPPPRRNFIDEEVFNKLASMGVQSAALSTDEEFYRRVTLDLTGRIPYSAYVRDFVASADPNKRSAAIDQLLHLPEFVDKWTMWMGDLLQNNANASNLNRNIAGRNAFYQFIRNAIQNDVSFKDMALQVVTATGNTYDAPSAAGFIANGFQPGGPTQDTYDMTLVKTATTFLGLGHYDCLLCHNGRGHLDALSVWGANSTRTEAEHMAAFFARTRFAGYQFPAGTPLADQQANFYYQSYQVSDVLNATYALPTTYGNRPNRPLMNGNMRTADPIYRTGATPAGENWRFEFARNMVNDPMFGINMANRLWKQMFNLGLVEPQDALDPARLDPSNPPDAPWTLQATHPVLLQALAGEIANRQYSLREFLRLIAESSAYQLSSRYAGNWDLSYVPLFARHYPRRLEGEEIHDAIAKSTSVFFGYNVQGFTSPVFWAMQFPDTSEPRANSGNANVFMNYFLRGNRDLLSRSQAVTIPQSSALMNDPFVMNKIHMSQSPTLQAVAKLPAPADQLEEMFLTFLNRMPTDLERAAGLKLLSAPATTAQKNAALEDLAWALINKLDFLFSY